MRSDAVDFLMGQKNGANYVVLYQMLCLMTINTNGRLSRQIGEVIIPYDVDKIQRDTKWFSNDTVRVALGLYAKLGLIYQEKDGTLVLANHSEMVGSETDYAAQKKLQRTNQRQIDAEHCGQCPQDVHTDVHKNVHTDIRDKILDIDKSSSSKDDSSYTGTRTTKSLVDFFRENVSKLSKTGEKELTGYIERMGADLVCAVMNKCVDLGGGSWAYVRKALEEAEGLNCKTVAEYNQLCPIGGSRAKGTRVDRSQPSGNDILSPERMARSRERLRKNKKGADDP
jgi:DnaD/phage-associated family protein|nr:MAG TPA_asm: Replication initiation and membrane attachment [Caudoviricetes sp.]